MQVQSYPLADTGQFSSLFLDYLSGKESLRPFYGQMPNLKGFEAQLANKKFDIQKRKNLVQALQGQYKGLANQPDFEQLLQENTFTVTTGHQLNLFTGPLYVPFKLISAINLAKQLKAAYPDYNFVPIYWMATEDHDFAEINHFSLFGKTYQWETDQKGAVGRMNPQAIQSLLDTMPEQPEPFKTAYTQHHTLTNATRDIVHQLFGQEGLICLDADDAVLKAEFANIMQADLQGTHTQGVAEQSQALEAAGYKAQVTARDINLFYLDGNVRERIVKEAQVYSVLNTELKFSEAQMQELVSTSPEKLSPNVILRPVYQEVILPNLAYLGGPGELAYWLQLKPVFDQHQVLFPILLPRNFGMIVNKASAKKMEKLDLTMTDLFMEEVALRKSFVEKNSSNTLDLLAEQAQLSSVFELVLTKASKIDKTLEAAVNGEKQKALNALENLEKRIKKAEERNQETEVSQVLALKQKFFPNGGLQERSENYLNFALNNADFLTQVAEVFDPLDFSFFVMTE
jgi:bacillithiol biosynthesis cysteine-adding enzyme BshC